jgi:cysteine desulfurase
VIYLDNNATTPILPEVVDAMLPYLREQYGNPSSDHPLGRAASDAVERARESVAALLGAPPGSIVFTSGGTEASNLAIRGLCAAIPGRRHLVTSAIEHPATVRPCATLATAGYRVTVVPVDATGRVDVRDVADAVGEHTALVSIMHSNNEIGTLQPIAELAGPVHASGAWLHTDAAQSVGKVEVDVEVLGVDLVTVAGHKLYAPKGVGALYVRPGTPLHPVLVGAGHEGGLRPGTENVASIVGLGVACAVARRDLAAESTRLRAVRDDLHSRLAARVPGLALSGHPDHRLPNTLNVRFPGVSGRAVLARAPDVYASTGSACHEGGGETPSAVQLALGLDRTEALGAVRLTLGRHTTVEDAQTAADRLIAAWEGLV